MNGVTHRAQNQSSLLKPPPATERQGHDSPSPLPSRDEITPDLSDMGTIAHTKRTKELERYTRECEELRIKLEAEKREREKAKSFGGNPFLEEERREAEQAKREADSSTRQGLIGYLGSFFPDLTNSKKK